MFVHHDPPAGAWFLSPLSVGLGWIYFAAWSLSFYPQTLSNLRRRSVAGFSLDFAALNVVGFAALTASYGAFLLSPDVRRQYRQRHHGHDNIIQWNDVAFAVHALIICVYQVYQMLTYRREPGQRVSNITRTALGAMGVLTGGTALLCIIGPRDGSGALRIEWLDFVVVLGYIKLVITLSKYVPQMRVNYVRKSTDGFRIEGILLDVLGGVLSLAQLFIDAHLDRDWNAVFGNPAKLGLPAISLFYDSILMSQHYIFYRGTSRSVSDEPEALNPAPSERTALLRNGDAGRH